MKLVAGYRTQDAGTGSFNPWLTTIDPWFLMLDARYPLSLVWNLPLVAECRCL